MKDKQTENVTRSNLQAWDQVAPIHDRHNKDDLCKLFMQPDYSSLDDLEIKILKRLEVKCKDVAQICCNNGRELISVKRMGANRCVGFDGSVEFVAQARVLARIANADVEFVCTDIYDLAGWDNPKFASSFDLVTITIGVLG